jgi:hypothetical protein|tara:strand:+ start:968 stop:1408 length:441 start_codon:yes stop_codon:yes gene_type:complete
MIKKFAELLGISKEQPKMEVETQTTLLQKKAGTYKEKKEEGEAFKQDAINYYTGVPAPAYLEDDPWFGPAPNLTEKQQDYMEQETLIKQQEEQERSEDTCESHDIHAKMYEIATQNWTTVAETQGGSENFQEGPGGWNSGTGLAQF